MCNACGWLRSAFSSVRVCDLCSRIATKHVLYIQSFLLNDIRFCDHTLENELIDKFTIPSVRIFSFRQQPNESILLTK